MYTIESQLGFTNQNTNFLTKKLVDKFQNANGYYYAGTFYIVPQYLVLCNFTICIL